MIDLPIYMDNHATTRTDPRVLDVMWPYFSEHYGNAASTTHRHGRFAADAVERARETIAAVIGADPQEIVFTSGATESNNLALKGTTSVLRDQGRHVVSAVSEHKSILDTLKRLEKGGWDVSLVRCDATGRVTPEAVEAVMTNRTVLVSVMAANNEVGTINPIGAIGRLCRERGILFHTDATQAVGKHPIDVEADKIDLLSLSAHKFYGPKGAGALYVRRRDPRVRLEPLFDGGGHERGFRSGTLAVPLLVGMGEAIRLADEERDADGSRILALRERLHRGLIGRLDGFKLNGHPKERLAANLNVSFAGVEGESLMMAVRDVAVSSGSACTSSNPEPSHVLLAMGLDEASARASLRFGLGRFTTPEEIDFAVESVSSAVDRLRSL